MYVKTQQVRPGPAPERVEVRYRLVVTSWPQVYLASFCAVLGLLCIALGTL